MSGQGPQNLPASIRAKLLNVSRATGEDFHVTLVRYAVERFLYRLSQSSYRSRFVLKGAMLMVLWMGKPHRPTQDLDLLGIGDLSDEHLLLMLNEIINTKVTEDGLEFDSESMTIAEIREGQTYQGKRVKLTCYLGKTRIRVQIDIGCGDAVVPRAKTLVYPTLLDLPAPRVRAYSRETMVAEKLEAMISLGMINSRMKDFYDLWFVSQRFTFAGHSLTQAIIATFKRRKTAFPKQSLALFLTAFKQDESKQTLWQTFVQRTDLKESTPGFEQIVEQLNIFLSTPLAAAADDKALDISWEPGGPWI
jgi:predicted nucleotidyltransferase component of viral defense system